ncbi:DHH family phosphoesterase [Candidatus Saccharibacteria bacterium]|nr:DHH family phosphoesterase [Candidatus Saccharibacteria bacterium]
MERQIEQFRLFIKGAKRILITSHISPDPDAVASVLLLGTTLKANFPDKKVEMVLEEKPLKDISFLDNYSALEFKPLLQIIQELQPDLLIMVDAMNFERCSRLGGTKVREAVIGLKTKIVVIDHHEELDVEPGALYFNKKNPATSQELYEILFYELGLKKPEGYAQTTLLGIISDTARHKYDNPRHRETFKIVSELIDAGASIEHLENKIERYSTNQVQAIAALIANIQDSGRGYTYSFIDQDFTNQPMSQDNKIVVFKAATEIFSSHFARNFENNDWGFVVYPELAAGQSVYAVSFRSVTGGVNVANLAHKLGGGGHKQAAGAKIHASNVHEAIQKVQAVIHESKN